MAVSAPHHPPSALPPGTRLAEFELRRVLGVGGFGIVYLAFDHALEREVAIKEYMPAALVGRSSGPKLSLLSEASAEPFTLGLRSFVNEARLLARFDAPGLVKVHRYWEENNTAYMAMPYYAGRNLHAVRRRMDAPPNEAWLRSVLQPLLGALERLHREGIYHRDISPDNVILQPDGQPVLLDFGAARRVLSDKSVALTAILKPAYAPIEQYAEAGAVKQGAWTDLYALGATLHFLLLGQAPPPATARMVADDMAPLASRSELLALCSSGFLQAIDWMLRPRPADRPQSVAALWQALLPPEAQPESEATILLPRRDATAGTAAAGAAPGPLPAHEPTVLLPRRTPPTPPTQPPAPPAAPATPVPAHDSAMLLLPLDGDEATVALPRPGRDDVTVRVPPPAARQAPLPMPPVLQASRDDAPARPAAGGGGALRHAGLVLLAGGMALAGWLVWRQAAPVAAPVPPAPAASAAQAPASAAAQPAALAPADTGPAAAPGTAGAGAGTAAAAAAPAVATAATTVATTVATTAAARAAANKPATNKPAADKAAADRSATEQKAAAREATAALVARETAASAARSAALSAAPSTATPATTGAAPAPGGAPGLATSITRLPPPADGPGSHQAALPAQPAASAAAGTLAGLPPNPAPGPVPAARGLDTPVPRAATRDAEPVQLQARLLSPTERCGGPAAAGLAACIERSCRNDAALREQPDCVRLRREAANR